VPIDPTAYIHSGEINESASAEQITQLQTRLNALSDEMSEESFHVGAVDGVWG